MFLTLMKSLWLFFSVFISLIWISFFRDEFFWLESYTFEEKVLDRFTDPMNICCRGLFDPDPSYGVPNLFTISSSSWFFSSLSCELNLLWLKSSFY